MDSPNLSWQKDFEQVFRIYHLARHLWPIKKELTPKGNIPWEEWFLNHTAMTLEEFAEWSNKNNKTVAEAKEGSKPKASLTRNASKKQVLDEYRNNLANGKWTPKQQRYSSSVKESAQRDAINELVRDGFDPRKLLSVPGFDSLADNVNRFRYK